MNNEYLSWDDIEAFCKQISYDVTKPDIIVPIVRGGLVPATIISHILGCPRIVPFQLQTRDCDDVFGNLIFQSINPETKFLIVDDVCDSGLTFDKTTEFFIENGFKNIQKCCLIKRTKSDPNIVSPYVKPFEWIVFPWEWGY